MKSKCEYCDAGDIPTVLDRNGVKPSISGEQGELKHAHDIHFWPCGNKIKSCDEYLEWMTKCEKLVDLDPEPASPEGKELAVIVAIIQGYENLTGKK